MSDSACLLEPAGLTLYGVDKADDAQIIGKFIASQPDSNLLFRGFDDEFARRIFVITVLGREDTHLINLEILRMWRGWLPLCAG